MMPERDYSHLQDSPKEIHTSLNESLSEYEERLAELAGRARALADRVAGSRPTAVSAGSTGAAAPEPHLVMRASNLRGLIASCEESLNRIGNAVG